MKFYAFQFQYGAIKRIGYLIISTVLFRFNSNMVRLRATTKIVKIKINKFQFQYGAIKSAAIRRPPANCAAFQFQYGAIKSPCQVANFVLQRSFNSNMVRLRVNEIEMKRLLKRSFNSNMVRLRGSDVRRHP